MFSMAMEVPRSISEAVEKVGPLMELADKLKIPREVYSKGMLEWVATALEIPVDVLMGTPLGAKIVKFIVGVTGQVLSPMVVSGRALEDTERIFQHWTATPIDPRLEDIVGIANTITRVRSSLSMGDYAGAMRDLGVKSPETIMSQAKAAGDAVSRLLGMAPTPTPTPTPLRGMPSAPSPAASPTPSPTIYPAAATPPVRTDMAMQPRLY